MNCSCSKLRKSNFYILRNHSSLEFCVIYKSFRKHLEGYVPGIPWGFRPVGIPGGNHLEGLKLIRTNFQEASLEYVGVINISARNFIIQHTLRNNYFGQYQKCEFYKCEFYKCDIRVLIFCPNTCPNIMCGHFTRLKMVTAPLIMLYL